jgi:hypothetical protein
MEAVPHSFIPQVKVGSSIALYKRMLLPVESFDFRPCIQCILVSTIPSCFHFAIGELHGWINNTPSDIKVTDSERLLQSVFFAVLYNSLF